MQLLMTINFKKNDAIKFYILSRLFIFLFQVTRYHFVLLSILFIYKKKNKTKINLKY